MDYLNTNRADARIAVLIPAYNEEIVLKGTIDALIDADCNVKDIFVVDDRSTDRTVEVAKACGVNVSTVGVNGGKAKAQKAALAHFGLLDKYDWIIFLDGDSKVDSYFCHCMYEAAMTDPTVSLYVGQVKSVKNTHIFSAMRASEYAYDHDLAKQGQSNFNLVVVSPGCASMYNTKMLAKVEIDHMTLAEDMDLTVQVHRNGGRVVYLSKALVFTQDPSTLKDYNKQVLRWYRGFWQVVLKHKVLSPFSRKQWIDAYMILLIVDAILFNRLLWLGVITATMPTMLPFVLGMDVVVAFLVVLYGSYRTRRTDIWYKFPVFYFIGYLNIVLYVRAMLEIAVFRKEILAWNKVERYDFDGKDLKNSK